ncbi:hypothetical protein BURPS305_7403 [Burkholderia pseudomallei 305]|uniref:Uncharacterized protein n=2 Tax=Burkholderia pseudomallei TaxID=28450 RepID=A0A0E1W1U2_BURPE|nr:hypothetical protein BURPS1106A_2730 [Burkholderia pseudomallei 1106a]ACQ95360.1 conserved hypothetical protein [Burkholderia pseudomallei MSHR346]EBA51345.1 hypothetical protein BURPS305_7403 [Burkholderia pseudomallei 305]EEC36358.1 conserved hypothetical protein [Burkholderia pseudomallei 576]EEH24011.1 conserved hypothetical protein [Burkholderia pseudomallei Pakistan 9]EET07185.1 hypothetical protein BURPS1710A_3228 [Burkholderia pseudomallei 1710a]VUD50423.1 unnamed protein product [
MGPFCGMKKSHLPDGRGACVIQTALHDDVNRISTINHKYMLIIRAG